MRKILALLACVTVLAAFAGLPALAQEDSLVVGSTTQLYGSFFTEMWSNNTADIDVRGLIHDYQTVAWTNNGSYQFNNTVVDSVISSNTGGGRTYRYTIFSDLKYCDGTPITAKDYVFSVLLQSAPQIKEIGGTIVTQAHLAGYDGYSKGETNVFSGVRLLGDYSFSLTISSDYLPYYYEMAFVNAAPYPLSVIAPGCDIADDGNGAYITGGFTADLLRGTILDADTGYLTHPAVTSGAYKLTGYDAALHVAEFETNPYYKGNYEGQKPSIRRLTYREVKNETMLDEFMSGSVGLINKISSGEAIAKVTEMSIQQQGKAVSYPRTGLSFVAFACEQGVTQSDKLRKAVAHCVDKQALCDEFLQGNGVPVYGYYGYGQWMIASVLDRLEELNLYKPDTAAAAALLKDDGWAYDESGNDFEQGADAQRYRKANGTLEPLVLKLAITRGNAAADIVTGMLRDNLAAIGAKLEVTEMETYELFEHYYRKAGRDYDMFFLGSNFAYIFDPFYNFHTADEYQGVMNTSGLRDEKLMGLAKALRETQYNDTAGYLEKWMALQSYWVQVLPMVPLYTNTYYDLSRMDLQNYFANNYWSWSAAILYATLGEAAPAAGT